jgi:hypothetical protein
MPHALLHALPHAQVVACVFPRLNLGIAYALKGKVLGVLGLRRLGLLDKVISHAGVPPGALNQLLAPLGLHSAGHWPT